MFPSDDLGRLVNLSFEIYPHIEDFLDGSMCKEFASNTKDSVGAGSIPWRRRSPGGGNGSPLQRSCLRESHGQRSLVGYNSWGPKESDTTQHTYKGPGES